MRATMTSWEVFNEGKNVSAHLAIMFCCCKNSAEGLTSKTHERGVDPYSAASCHSVVVIKNATSTEDVRHAHYHNRH